MTWQHSPYTIPLMIGALVTLFAAYVSWRRQKTLSGIALSLLMLSLAIWSAGYALQLAGADEATKVFWRNIKNLGVVPVATLWLVTVLQYTGYRRWLTKEVIAILAIEPLTGYVISQTNNWHHFFERSATLVFNGVILVRAVNYGWWFWFNTIYSYVLFIASTILLVHTFLRAQRLYRRQILTLLAFSLIPWLGNATYVSKLVLNWGRTPIPDVTPFLFLVGGILVLWGTWRYQLVDIVPIARDTIISNMRNGVVVLDTRGYIVDLNPQAEKIIGYGEPEVVGKRATIYLPLWTELVQALEEKVEGQGEQALTIDGKTHYFDWRLSPLYERGNVLIGWVLVFRDSTRQKEAQSALEASNEQLRAEIVRREQLISELDAFAHTVAHDLKNPLSIIIGYTDVLLLELAELKSAEAQSVHAQKIDATARKMGHIIDELLLMASIRQEDVKLSPLNTAQIVSQAQQRLTALIMQYQAEIILPETWHTAFGYAPWIEEIWENLLSNAIKYGGTPPVVTLSSSLENGSVWFWIADNGRGLPPDVCETIFNEKHSQKYTSRTGHGLGLSIVRRIVEKHGGMVQVFNKPNPQSGCVFGFSLPAQLNNPHSAENVIRDA